MREEFKSRKFIGFILILLLIITMLVIELIFTIDCNIEGIGGLAVALYGIMVGGNAVDSYSSRNKTNGNNSEGM